jgi:hypothetical protein
MVGQTQRNSAGFFVFWWNPDPIRQTPFLGLVGGGGLPRRLAWCPTIGGLGIFKKFILGY